MSEIYDVDNCMGDFCVCNMISPEYDMYPDYDGYSYAGPSDGWPHDDADFRFETAFMMRTCVICWAPVGLHSPNYDNSGFCDTCHPWREEYFNFVHESLTSSYALDRTPIPAESCSILCSVAGKRCACHADGYDWLEALGNTHPKTMGATITRRYGYQRR